MHAGQQEEANGGSTVARRIWFLFPITALLILAGCGGGSSAGSGYGSGIAGGGGGSGAGGGSSPAAVTVDFGTADQVIRGFGGSTAFLGALTAPQAKALFSPADGLGLSILRVRIDPGGSAGNQWVTSQWTDELTNAQQAEADNPNALVFASPWTPPVAWKTSSASQPYYSGSPACPQAGLCGGYLDPAHYADYANYLEDFVQYFQTNGVNLYGISMQNEPDYSAAAGQNYESCSWTPAQMDTWVADDASTLTTKLIMPESYGFNPAQAEPTLNDPNAVGRVAIVAGHLYGTQPSYYTQAENLGKDVWMTEHYLTPAAGAGSQPDMADALSAAEEIHNSMVTGQYNAYVWWWVWNDPNDNVNYGLIDSSTANPQPTFYGDALGQFSRFIQPGYHRYNATANPSSNVYVSAYAGSNHYVIVAINAGSAALNQTFHLQNATVTSMTPWQTTSGGGLQQQSAVTVSGGSFTYSLPAQSITTFVD
jgi:glucuronoarabinoxylan endo-1,4-beta-xylanase